MCILHQFELVKCWSFPEPLNDSWEMNTSMSSINKIYHPKKTNFWILYVQDDWQREMVRKLMMMMMKAYEVHAKKHQGHCGRKHIMLEQV